MRPAWMLTRDDFVSDTRLPLACTAWIGTVAVLVINGYVGRTEVMVYVVRTRELAQVERASTSVRTDKKQMSDHGTGVGNGITLAI